MKYFSLIIEITEVICLQHPGLERLGKYRVSEHAWKYHPRGNGVLRNKMVGSNVGGELDKPGPKAFFLMVLMMMVMMKFYK
jgi:hypothetical protein